MLIICPTPIGNLDDLSARQRDALANADIIACEDTRHTGKLLERIATNTPDAKQPKLVSYHEHNALERAESLAAAIEQGKTVVLVSDAGTPTISDPGYRLVSECTRRDITITALPGPVAGIVALSASGLPTDRFFFEGFLPAKRQARRERLDTLRQLGVTTILYESPHRITKTLEDVSEVFGHAHPVCVGRELTKKFEEYLRGSVGEVLETLTGREKLRGEFVLILAPVDETLLRERLEGGALEARIEELLDGGMRTRDVRDALAKASSLPSSELYELIESIKKR
ncbi:unnamed protein product [Laminaria digitata]